MEDSMKTHRSAAVLGLVAVPPNPDPSSEDPTSDKVSAQRSVWQPDKTRRSLRAVLAVVLSAIAFMGIAIFFVSVHATSAPPVAASPAVN
jgi:hypothetical protein